MELKLANTKEEFLVSVNASIPVQHLQINGVFFTDVNGVFFTDLYKWRFLQKCVKIHYGFKGFGFFPHVLGMGSSGYNFRSDWGSCFHHSSHSEHLEYVDPPPRDNFDRQGAPNGVGIVPELNGMYN